MSDWYIITGEYPPQAGGVSDYTESLARGLVGAGDRVTILAPPCAKADADHATHGMSVCRLPDRFGRGALKELDAVLDDAPGDARILVQYVPQAFGWKALNVPFCWWLKSRKCDTVWVMFHEVALPLDRSLPIVQNAVALVTRRMAAIVAASAQRAFVSIPAWEPVLRALGASVSVEWLPVPSAIPVVSDAPAIASLRQRLASGGEPIVAHFGTYGAHTRPLLEEALPPLLDACACRVVLLGRGSDRVAAGFAERHPAFRDRVRGTGALGPRELSIHLSASDVMLQPYPDGISSRRTSAMAGLAHGRATATTEGALTESIWRGSGAVALAPTGDVRALAAMTADLAQHPSARARMAQRALDLYDTRFDIRHTIARLRQPAAAHIALGAAS